jgi:hypothetical protein
MHTQRTDEREKIFSKNKTRALMMPPAGALTSDHDVVTLHTTSCLHTCFTKMQPTPKSQHNYLKALV